MEILPYLKSMAKGGDKAALACLKSMAGDGDDDAADAVHELEGGDVDGGNGSGPGDALDGEFGKSEDFGPLFDLDALDAEIADAEPFAKSEDYPEVPDAREIIGAQDGVAAAMSMDADDLVEGFVKGVSEAIDRLGDATLWNGTGVEAMAKSVTAIGEILHAQTDALGELRKGMAELRATFLSRGAGLAGVDAAQPVGRPRLRKSLDDDALGAPAGGDDLNTLRKSLRTMRGATSRDDTAKQAMIGEALEDLTIGETARARALVAG